MRARIEHALHDSSLLFVQPPSAQNPHYPHPSSRPPGESDKGRLAFTMDEKPDSIPTHSVHEAIPSPPIKPQARKPYDPAVTFEEYNYYAQKTREEELTLKSPVMNVRQFFAQKAYPDSRNDVPAANLTGDNFRSRENRLQITDEEWANASRSFRSASWGACKKEQVLLPRIALMPIPFRLLLDHHRYSRTLGLWIHNGYIGLGTW